MRSNILKFAQQGLWPALTGGWHYNPNHSNFTNIFHMYTWLFLLCLPFTLYLSTTITWVVIVIYTLILAILISCIKFISAHLHKTFDVGEQMQRKTMPVIEETEQNDHVPSNDSHGHLDSWCNMDSGDMPSVVGTPKPEHRDTAGHLELWEEISRQDFSEVEIFNTFQDPHKGDKNKTHIAHVHAHSSNAYKDTPTKAEGHSRKKHRVALDKCRSLPDISSSSSSDSDIDISLGQIGTLTKEGSSGSEKDTEDTDLNARGDGKMSRKRTAPKNGVQGPMLKRSYSSTDAESSVQSDSKLLPLEADSKSGATRSKSHSLPSAAPSGQFLKMSGLNNRLSQKLDSSRDMKSNRRKKGALIGDEDEGGGDAVNNNNKAVSDLNDDISSLTSLSSDPTLAASSKESDKPSTEITQVDVTTTSGSSMTDILSKNCMNPSSNRSSLEEGTSAAENVRRKFMDETNNRISLEQFLNESTASIRMADFPRDHLPVRYFDSDGDDTSGHMTSKAENDAAEIPLLSTSSAEPSSFSGIEVPKDKKVTYKFSPPISRKSRPRGSLEDSESLSVEENFRECLHNFNFSGSGRPRHHRNVSATTSSAALAQRSRSSYSRGRNFVPANRSHSFDTSAFRPRGPATWNPTGGQRRRAESGGSGRQRHPAGTDTQPVKADLEEGDSRSPKLTTGGSSSNGDDVELTSRPSQKLHFAKNHTDTTEGAIHSFQDENGRWMTYTFSNDGAGTAEAVSNPLEQRSGSVLRSRNVSGRTRGDSSSTTSNRDRRSNDGDAGGDVIDVAMRSMLRARMASRGALRLLPEHQDLREAFRRSIDTGQRMAQHGTDTSPPSITTPIEMFNIERRAPSPKIKIFYKVKVFPCKTITIQYDRLALMDLLDRSIRCIEVSLSVLFAALVACLGILVLAQGNLLYDLWAFWFCVVIATSQFSLIRSVQPDSASPTHGHNRVIAYSRPFYFTICASLLLLFNYLADEKNVRLPGITIYGATLFDNNGCAMGRDFMLVFTLLLPFIFVFGLLPQVNTFVMYLCEQTEIHAFGGSASTSLEASAFSVGRSFLTLLLVYGFAYGAMLAKEGSQHILFSAFCGFLVSFSYHLSRQTSSPWVLWKLLKSKVLTSPACRHSDDATEKSEDPSKEADNVGLKYELEAVDMRLQSDVVLCPLIAVFMFAIHCSTGFTALQPALTTVLYIMVGVIGAVLHYFIPQLRKHLPWLLFSRPILKSKEHGLFEVKNAAVLMWYERLFAIVCFMERNFLFPLLVVNTLTVEANLIIGSYGLGFGCVILSVVGLKLLRSAYSVPAMQYLVFSFSVLFVRYDAQQYNASVLVTCFFFGILFVKFQDLVLKLQFWMVYVAPWQITWGSAFHAFAQPFVVPHSALLTAHALLASLLQAPFVPFLGSALFLSSYPRPLKFWERNYKTKRIDHSNTRLSSQIDRGPHSDDNNLNSIFYEHLTYSLQKSLAGDISLGRWGNVYSGDCFILASENLNALVHVVEKGNGIITFQLRGLEFRGTYCQQREVEAINEGADDSKSCCCWKIGRLKGFLSFNSAFNQRWLAWQVIVSNYVLDGYSITDNNATTMLGVFDLRKILIGYIVKSIIFFLISHDSLETWLNDPNIRQQIEPCERPDYADEDSTFAVAIDDDYDVWLFGVSLAKFHQVYGEWIEHCAERRQKTLNRSIESGRESKLVTLCFAISVLGRRALGSVSHNVSTNLDAFLYGLHALFKGDLRITLSKDEWIFTDMNLLHEVVVPGVRTALKLHQDHFACPGEYDESEVLYDAIYDYTKNMVITHEGDPVWRRAVLSNTPSLLALRRVVSDTFVDQYSVVTLSHRALGFNIVKVNRESVRGLWAGQQNELVFLRNRNPERGSIQNAKQVLRNMINSSCDQPIGYPIYVSPLTSSYASTNEQLTGLLGGPITFQSVRDNFSKFINCLRQSCSGSCNSGGSAGMQMQQAVPLQPLAISRISTRSGQFHNLSSRSSTQSRPLQRQGKSSTPPSSDRDFSTTSFGTSRSNEHVHRRAGSAVDMATGSSRHGSTSKRLSTTQAETMAPELHLVKGSLTHHSSASVLGRKSDASLRRSRDSNEEPSSSRLGAVVSLLSSRSSGSTSMAEFGRMEKKRESPHASTTNC
uniref:Pecanex-like protein n=1 Tax=Phallusia mammillata TaxID=59560 RepID=A0A6F9DNF0_9ASCI|nr:pecanex-like protein 1 [Phallusia mammillata]